MTKQKAVLAFVIALVTGLGIGGAALWGELKVGAETNPTLSVQNSILKVEPVENKTLVTFIGFDNEGKLLDCLSRAPKIATVEISAEEGFSTLDEKPKTNFISGDCQSSWQYELNKEISVNELSIIVLDQQNNKFVVSSH